MAATFWGSGLKGKSRRNLFYEREGEHESEHLLFQNLTTPPTNPAPPLAKHAAMAVVPTAPMPRVYPSPPVSPPFGDELEVSMLIPRAQEPGLVSPSKMQWGTQFGLGATSGAGKLPFC